MPLGRGLSSLIPKKNNQAPLRAEDFTTLKIDRSTIAQEPSVLLKKNTTENEAADAFRTAAKTEENFSSPKPAQASGHGIPSEARDERAEEQASQPRWGGRSGLREGKFSSAHTQDSIFQIEVDKIKPNPHQPRKNFDEAALKELAASIQEFGILQPLVVSKIEKENEMGTSVEYELIAGERRLMASKMLGWERVPAIIRKISQKSEQLELAVIENLQRENLDPIETARAYAKLQDEFGVTQREIAQRLGKSRETIANTLRLLNLSTEIQDAVSKNQINESQARLLLIIEEPTQRQNLFNELLKNSLSVRELREKVKKTGDSQNTKYKIQDTSVDPEIIELREKLTEILGADVKINLPKPSKKQGEIVITFYSPEEIKGIIEKFKSSSID